MGGAFSRAPKADAATARAVMEKAGYNMSRKPLRVNLKRQYMIKEAAEMHGGHGEGASGKFILAGLGVAFGLSFVLSGAAKVFLNHDVPTSLQPSWKAKSLENKKAYQTEAIRNHKIGAPIQGNVWDVEGEKRKLAENGESD